MIASSYRYTSSPETILDADLARFRAVKDGETFVSILDGILANELTNDFWAITLPANLDSSSARNPELFAYVAAQNKLGAPALFSHKSVRDLIDPAIQSKKKALERHHLFPRAFLERNGVTERRAINQMANHALLEWPDNLDISDGDPKHYVPKIAERFSQKDWNDMHAHHALPMGWEDMDYGTFLEARRTLMAAIIRRGYEQLL